MRLSLPEALITASPIIQRLREHHFEAVFVGGAVRDTVLGFTIKDVDIATSARPEQVLELFERCIPTGLQHGTITVLHNDMTYEVTTFREESAYEAFRKPESVQYITDLDGDLLRRDFTMNAMALTATGDLHDPYNGLLDIQKRKIRCVGDADARFQEDALRMLRAVRFIAVYGFAPTSETWRALLRHRPLMKYIALERVHAELDKMLAGSSPQRALRYVTASGLLLHLKEQLPAEVANQLQQFDSQVRNENWNKLFSKLHLLNDVDLRWAAIGIIANLSLDNVQQVLRIMRFSNLRFKSITTIMSIQKEMLVEVIRSHEKQLQKCWTAIIIRYGKRSAAEWLEVASVLPTAEDNILPSVIRQLESYMSSLSITTLKQLKVNGKQLAQHLERAAGPWISELLSRLLLAVAVGEIQNEQMNLLNQAVIWDKEVN